MHSLIKQRTLADIHTPCDYIIIFETARLHLSSHKVTEIHHNNLMKLSGSYVTNIRLGSGVGFN